MERVQNIRITISKITETCRASVAEYKENSRQLINILIEQFDKFDTTSDEAAGMVPVPQSIQPAASPSPNPPLPSSPQVVNIPDSTQDKEMTTPVKESPVRSPSANSTNSSPSADATIKVRLAGSEDFFEVELSDIGDTYNSLVKCFAEELDVKCESVAKVRKLPNILIRKDRDVKRIKNGSEFEVELNPDS